MKNLVEINRTAITVLSFLTSPAGLLCVIAIAASVETLGIALFFSGLFIDKAKSYIANAGFSFALTSPALVSLAIGAVLSLTIMLGVLVMKLINRARLSAFISVAFACLAVVTYWQVLNDGATFNSMKLLGVCLMVAVPSLIVSVCSSHLADMVLTSDTFRTMQAQIFKKATGHRVAELSTSQTSSKFENFSSSSI